MASKSLSHWLQPFYQKHSQLGSAIKGLASFFRSDSSVGQLRRAAINRQAEAAAASSSSKTGVKRPRQEPLQETQASINTEMYKNSSDCGGGEDQPPSSIFATPTCGISFGRVKTASCGGREGACPAAGVVVSTTCVPTGWAMAPFSRIASWAT